MPRVKKRKGLVPLYENWYGHAAYDVAGGYIRPPIGAEIIEYNPWEPFRALQDVSRTVDPPYRSFVELGRQLTPHEQLIFTEQQTPAIERLMVDWCAQWGPLGILASTASEITLAPRWQEVDPALLPYRRGTYLPARRAYIKVQHRYFRTGGAWHAQTNLFEALTQEKPLEMCVPKAEWPEGIEPPGATIWRWDQRRWERDKSLGQVARFFPSVAPHEQYEFVYPLPGSAEFKTMYAESVQDFAHECIRFRQAVEAISRDLAGVGPLIEDQKVENEFVLEEAYFRLRSLDSTMGHEYSRVEGGLQTRTVSSSLLASFARMVLLDLARGRRILRCQRCDHIYVSDEPRARYCSPRCRNTALSKRYRESLRRQGKPTRPPKLKTLRPSRKEAGLMRREFVGRESIAMRTWIERLPDLAPRFVSASNFHSAPSTLKIAETVRFWFSFEHF